MTTAHIFYIPIMLLTGLLAGFFVGRSYTEKEFREAAKRRRRQEALKRRAERSEDVTATDDGLGDGTDHAAPTSTKDDLTE